MVQDLEAFTDIELVELILKDNENGKDLLHFIESNTDIPKEAHDKELENKVNKAISLLPEKYKSALVLKFFEQKDYNEISDIMQIPSGTVGTYINRGKSEFKKIFLSLDPKPKSI